MFNKLEFNNLVITNKQNIQRAKAQAIQKLVQKIKKLNYSLEKKPDHERNKERLGKSTLSLEELKKLKCIDLMKQLLLLDKSPTAILTNGLSSPEEVSLAMVAVNKIMQDIVNVFKEKLGITEENKSWKEDLMRTSKRRIKIMRTERKRKNRQEMKEQKVMARKRTEWLKNQNVTENQGQNTDKVVVEPYLEEDDEGAIVSTLGYWKIEPIDIEAAPASMSVKRKTKRERLSQVKDARDKNSTTKINSTNASESEKQVKSNNTEMGTANAVNDFKTVKSPPLQNDHEQSQNNTKSSFSDDLREPTSFETEQYEVTHVVDPFFLTDTGDSYLSTAVVIRNGKVLETPTNNTTKDNKVFHKNMYKMTNKTNKPSKVSSYRSNDKGVTHNSFHKISETRSIIDLHPSWAAKQKLKPVISSFQGKKIIFDDGNDFNDKEERQNNSKIRKDRSFKKQPTPNLQINQEYKKKNSLHPSWEAKQALKPVITEFKGKKITFGIEGEKGMPVQKAVSPKKNVTKSNETDGLHPSWAAKQKQKPTITAFQGKKITFDNDE